MVVWCLFFVERCDAGDCCRKLIGRCDIFLMGRCFFQRECGIKKLSYNTVLGIKFALIC